MGQSQGWVGVEKSNNAKNKQSKVVRRRLRRVADEAAQHNAPNAAPPPPSLDELIDQSINQAINPHKEANVSLSRRGARASPRRVLWALLSSPACLRD